MRLLGIVVLAVAVALFAAHRRTATSATKAPTARTGSGAPTMAVPRQPPPPRPAVVRQKDLATTDARYDPVAYLEQEGGALDAREVYLNEPRDPRFAPIFEKRINTTMETILDELKAKKHVKSVHVDCKTLSCSTTIEADSRADAQQLYDEVNGIILGDGQQPGMDLSDPDHPRVTIVNLYRPGSRDDGNFQQILDLGMRPALDLAKKKLSKDKPDEAVP
jgi:hypothetical protein